MKLIMALCDALGFDVEVNKFGYRDKTNFNVHMIGRDYKLIKREYVQVSDGEKYDIKDVFRSGGVLYWKDKQ